MGACPVPPGSEDYEVRGTSWRPMLYAAGACTGATIAISLSLIVLHLRRYRAPKEQRQIIRITFAVALYATFAFLEIYSYESAKYIDPIGDYYEAFGLCALYLLFVQYAAPSGTFDDELFTAVKAAEETHTGFDWPRISWIMVFQYPIVATIVLAIIEGTEATERYCPASLSPAFGHLWAMLIQSVSIGACVMAIISFRNHMKKLMKVRRGLSKILCFKVIVFIRFAQAWVFSLLLQYHVIKPNAIFSYNDFLWGVPGLATCAEMVIFSLMFWYSFSSTEYGSDAKPRQERLPVWKAALDALNPTDLFLGIARIFSLGRDVHSVHGFKQWRQEAGVRATIRQGVAKHKARKAGKNGKYEQLDGSTEDLVRPVESYHTPNLSSTSQQFATEYTPMTDMSRQPLYQPPQGSPPDDARAYPMSGPFGGRPQSPSQSQWNGQTYNRTPSPSVRSSGDIA